MESDIRLLGFIASLRGFGLLMLSSFLALYLHNVLGLGFAVVGALVLAYGLPAILSSTVAGLVADRVGRRRLLVLCLAGESVGFLLLAYGMALGSLAAISGAATFSLLLDYISGPPSSAYVADLAAGSERTKGFTWIRVGYNAGVAAGVGTGGFLVGIVGFPAVTALAGGFVALSFVLVALFLHPSPYDLRLHEARRSERTAPAAVASGGPAHTPSGGPRVPMRQSLRDIARDRTFVEACLAFSLAALVGGQWGVTFQLFANTTLGLDYGIIGLGVALNALIVVLGQMYTTRAVLGRRHTSVGILGLAFYCVAFLGIGVAGEWTVAPLAVFLVATVVATVGENLTSIPFSTLPSNLAPAHEIGNYNGAFQTLLSAGWTFSAFLGGLVLAFVPDSLLVWVVLVLPAVPSLFLLRHLSRRIPEAANRA